MPRDTVSGNAHFPIFGANRPEWSALAQHVEECVDVRRIRDALAEYLSDYDDRLLFQRQARADPESGRHLNRSIRFWVFRNLVDCRAGEPELARLGNVSAERLESLCEWEISDQDQVSSSADSSERQGMSNAGARRGPAGQAGPSEDDSGRSYFLGGTCWSFRKTVFAVNSGFDPAGFDSACGRGIGCVCDGAAG